MSKPAGERYTIAVDFDGVIHSYTSPWVAPEVIPDPPIPGAVAWLNAIWDDLDVVIFTTRGSTQAGQHAVREWLERHGVTWGAYAIVTDVKPPALVYLDDRAMRFDGSNFPTVQDVHNARPWNIAQRPHSRQRGRAHE